MTARTGGHQDIEMAEIDDLLTEYRELQAQKDRQTTLKDADPQLNEWKQKLLKLEEIAQKIASVMGERSDTFGIADIVTNQNELKERIRLAWQDPEKKTYKSPIGTVTLRTTKSLVVDSAKAVIEFLLKNDQCEEGIAKFNLPTLRKFADAGLLNKGATHYDEKQSISIKLTEAE